MGIHHKIGSSLGSGKANSSQPRGKPSRALASSGKRMVQEANFSIMGANDQQLQIMNNNSSSKDI